MEVESELEEPHWGPNILTICSVTFFILAMFGTLFIQIKTEESCESTDYWYCSIIGPEADELIAVAIVSIFWTALLACYLFFFLSPRVEKNRVYNEKLNKIAEAEMLNSRLRELQDQLRNGLITEAGYIEFTIETKQRFDNNEL